MTGRSDGSHSELVDALLAETAAVPRSRVAVTGAGPLASEVARALGRSEPSHTDGRALAVIETTGESEELARACAEVADGGLIVLAQDPVDSLDLDLYRDVHRRGLVVVGVPAGRR